MFGQVVDSYAELAQRWMQVRAKSRCKTHCGATRRHVGGHRSVRKYPMPRRLTIISASLSMSKSFQHRVGVDQTGPLSSLTDGMR